ncbi:hypothetical protein F5B17DRAFT_225766 [Nemania serpens]|nr:hypothetical protein F5B17DRAFT_225766 [Nemania serpens]
MSAYEYHMLHYNTAVPRHINTYNPGFRYAIGAQVGSLPNSSCMICSTPIQRSVILESCAEDQAKGQPTIANSASTATHILFSFSSRSGDMHLDTIRVALQSTRARQRGTDSIAAFAPPYVANTCIGISMGCVSWLWLRVLKEIYTPHLTLA